MKTICLIKDKRPLWEEVIGYLKSANAEVFTSDESALSATLPRKPDLIITGEKTYRSMNATLQNTPKIIVTDGKQMTVERKTKDVYFIVWPVYKEAFLEITARLLYISERRVFNALITITSKDKNETFIGRSENFSMTGIAFKCDKPLSRTDNVIISFYVTGLSRRVSLEAEVMRSAIDPTDGTTYYGARFINLSAETKAILTRFIEKGK
ncbi:MAG: PilZ domain-containing protein [Nitrospirae bacterium]|nr:PilZ domain-containing protein [Nitrospirota bacterium]